MIRTVAMLSEGRKRWPEIPPDVGRTVILRDHGDGTVTVETDYRPPHRRKYDLLRKARELGLEEQLTAAIDALPSEGPAGRYLYEVWYAVASIDLTAPEAKELRARLEGLFGAEAAGELLTPSDP